MPSRPDERPDPGRRSPRLIAWGAVVGASGLAGVVAGLSLRPLRELGALCIFGAVGGAMMLRRGLCGPPDNAGSGSGDGGSDSDGGDGGE